VLRHSIFTVTVDHSRLAGASANRAVLPADVSFRSRSQAQQWCTALNQCVGEPWFIIESHSQTDRSRSSLPFSHAAAAHAPSALDSRHLSRSAHASLSRRSLR
jgi:hypothetical protein